MENNNKIKRKSFDSNTFRSLVETGSDLVGVIDVQGNYLFVSPSCEHILGFPADYFIGRNAFEFIHPEDIPRSLTALSSILTQKTIHLEPFRFLNSNGEWRWIETVATNQLENSSIKGIVVNSRDITEKKKNDEQLRHLALLAKQTINSVIITDSAEKIIWVNDAFTNMYEYTLEEVSDKKMLQILSGKDTLAETVNHIESCIEQKRVVDTELFLYSKSGIKRCIQIQVQPVYDHSGKLVNYFSLHHDISETRTLQNRLINEQEELQRKITEAVILAQEQERNIISQELHDNVSQLLTTAKLYLDLIRNEESICNPMIHETIEIINMSINQVREISHALSLSTLAEDPLHDSIEQLISHVNGAMKTSFKLTVNGIDDSLLSSGLKLSIYRIIQEQVNNILKHSEAEQAFVQLKQNGKQLNLEIKDNGVGFDPSVRKKGVGLKNIRSRVDAFGGRLNLQSSSGNGCHIHISFDLYCPDQTL